MASSQPRLPRAALAPPRRVLFAEDDPWVREGTAAVLVEMGFTVVAVRDGVDALAAFEGAQARGEGFDLAVLDVRMPRVDGTEIVDRLLAGDPTILVLLSSGHDREDLDAALFVSGRVGYVAKPLDRAALRDQLAVLEGAPPPRAPGDAGGPRRLEDDLAHDLNNVFAAIDLLARLLERGSGDAAELRRRAADIRRATERGVRLVAELRRPPSAGS